MNFKGIAKIVALLGLGAYCWNANPWRSITHQPGVLVKSTPVQTAAPRVAIPDVGDWKLVPTAEYKLHGLVLGTKRYHSGEAADLVPIDVAIGWGRMSDQSVLDQFTLSMSNRFFFYKWENEPAIPVEEIMRSAANNHIISADSEVRKVIKSLIPGHIVTLRGYLVNALHPGGGSWNSSLRRDDTGNGACELFYVTEASAVESLSQEMDAQFAAR